MNGTTFWCFTYVHRLKPKMHLITVTEEDKLVPSMVNIMLSLCNSEAEDRIPEATSKPLWAYDLALLDPEGSLCRI